MSVHPSLLKRKVQLEQELSLNFMETELKAIHSIYFDLSVLQDINIGTLLLHTKTEKEYNDILSCIPVYLSRIEPSICKYFPSTTLTDTYIQEYVSDPKNAELLFKASPHTTIWFLLPAIFQKIYDKNRILDGAAKFKCDMFVNMYPTGYHTNPTICKYLANKIKKINPKIAFHTVDKPAYRLQKITRTRHDLYFVENMGDWMSTDHPTYKEFYDDLLYEHKQFFAKRLITSTDVVVPVTEAFSKSRDFIRAFTGFDYLDVGIPGVQYVPPVSTEHEVEPNIFQ